MGERALGLCWSSWHPGQDQSAEKVACKNHHAAPCVTAAWLMLQPAQGRLFHPRDG